MAFNLNATFTGLRTLPITIPTAGSYPFTGTLQLPTIDEGSTANSQVVITITQTGSVASAILATASLG